MSEENKSCDCGECGHGDNCGCEGETVTLTFEDNSVVECNIIGIFDAEDRQYIALMPIDEEEAIIFRFIEADDNYKLEQIETDDEYETVAATFLSIMEADGETDKGVS